MGIFLEMFQRSFTFDKDFFFSIVDYQGLFTECLVILFKTLSHDYVGLCSTQKALDLVIESLLAVCSTEDHAEGITQSFMDQDHTHT